MDRGRALAVPDQVGIAIVLEDRHAIGFRKLQELGAAGHRHDGAGRILHGRNGVDVFRRDAAAIEVGERRRQRVHPHPLLVERDADHVDAEPVQPVQRSLIAVTLDDDGIAARQQRRVDEIERLQRAGHDQYVVGRAVDGGIALQFRSEKFAQRTIALRTVGKPIGRERLALAPEHGAGGIDQAVHRYLLGVVVAADKAVFRKARPSRRGRGQPRWQEWSEVERCGGHGPRHSLVFGWARS